MLTSMRTGLFSKLFFGMLLLAGVGLVMTDWSGTLRSGVGATDVAKVGKERISLVSFDRLVRANLEGLAMNPQEAYKMGLIDGLLRNVANQKLLVSAASDAGLRVGEEQLAETLASLLEPYRQQGLPPKEALQRVANLAGGERALFNEIRTSETVALFQGSLAASSGYVPQSLAADFGRIAGETRTARILTMRNDRVTLSVAPSESELEDFYQSVKQNYAVPERRSFTVAVIDGEKVKNSINISDEEIESYYDDHKDNFRIDETMTLEMVVAADKAKIEEIIAGLTNDPKADMQALTKEAGLEAGWQKPDTFGENDLPQSFASSVKGKKAGDIIGPIETAFGWHAIRVNELNPARPRPLAEVSKQIKEQLASEAISVKLEQTSNALDDRLAGDESFEEIAADMPVKLTKVELLSRSRQEKETLKDFQPTDQMALLKAAYELDEAESAPLFPLANGTYATVFVQRVIPSSVPELKTIRKSLEQAWTVQQKEQINRTQAQAVLDEMRKNGFDAAVSKAKGASSQTVSLKRTQEPNATLDRVTIDELFAARPGTPVQVPTKNGFVLAVVESVTYPANGTLGDEVDLSLQAPVIQTIFEDSSAKNGLRLNRALLDRTYGQQQAQ